jgi:hypothetical protein
VEGILSPLNFTTGLGVSGKSIVEGKGDFLAFFLVNISGWDKGTRYLTPPEVTNHGEVSKTFTFETPLYFVYM